MRANPHAVIVTAVICLLLTAPAVAQSDPIENELDEFWAEVSRTVAEGDHEGMIATYHPDGVWVAATSDSYRTQLFTDDREQLAADNAETRSGARTRRVEFRFSSRVHDQNTAHEVGIYHYWEPRPDQERIDAYGVVDSYLVKKDGRWMILVEIQREESTKEEWDALR